MSLRPEIKSSNHKKKEMVSFDVISYVVLPGLIFLARVADVTVGTVKLMFVVNNAKRVAALLGFLESLIAIVALSRIMQDASNFMAYVMYASRVRHRHVRRHAH